MHAFIRSMLLVGSLLLAGCVGYPTSGNAYPGSYPGRGYPGGNYGAGYPATDAVVRCESQDGRTRHCDADVRGGVRLVRQLSRTDCVRERTWGYDNRGIWVGGGCRAEFVTGGGGGGYGEGSQQTIRCESQEGQERHCSVPIRSGAQLSRQLSRTPCVQGRNWRWDRGGIWVTQGCRGEFRVY